MEMLVESFRTVFCVSAQLLGIRVSRGFVAGEADQPAQIPNRPLAWEGVPDTPPRSTKKASNCYPIE